MCAHARRKSVPEKSRPPLDEFGLDEFARAFPVSRETLKQLEAYVALLSEWNRRYNLVSANSLKDVWRRHILDSAQLALYLPGRSQSLVDLGSGAGFPGLVLGAVMGDRVRVTLIEATSKKCHFLREAASLLRVPADVRNERIEDSEPQKYDVVVARACAPLPRLLAYAYRFCSPTTLCLFLKGQNVGAELTEARNSWRMEFESHTSLSDPSGTLMAIRGLAFA